MWIHSRENEHIRIRHKDFGDPQHLIAGAEQDREFLIVFEGPLHGLDLSHYGSADVRDSRRRGLRLSRFRRVGFLWVGWHDRVEHCRLCALDRLICKNLSQVADRHAFDASIVFLESNLIENLLSRASIKALGDPGPDDAQLRTIFEAATRAPDHGKLRPSRFFVVRGDARRHLSELFVAGINRREPGAAEPQIAKEREKPLRAPVTIVVVARLTPGHKVPEIEQTLSAGAAAMNILNAVHALGFAAKWVTGANCYDPEFKREFGLDPADQLIGFLHVGTPVEKVDPPARPDPAEFVSEWK